MPFISPKLSGKSLTGPNRSPETIDAYGSEMRIRTQVAVRLVDRFVLMGMFGKISVRITRF
jgi:hypothetical protein